MASVEKILAVNSYKLIVFPSLKHNLHLKNKIKKFPKPKLIYGQAAKNALWWYILARFVLGVFKASFLSLASLMAPAGECYLPSGIRRFLSEKKSTDDK